jgi:hypothetical protein
VESNGGSGGGLRKKMESGGELEFWRGVWRGRGGVELENK